MLQQIDIQNFALIGKVSMQIGKGLNLLTGETGAGKSIIIDAINAILGERISKDFIRTGKDKALIEAVFNVKGSRVEARLIDYGIEPEEDGTLIVSREFTAAGKNACRINGKLATVSMLKELGELLIDIHGQHDNQSLLRTESHVVLLDSFSGSKIQSMKSGYREKLSQYKHLKNKLKELSGSPAERERRIDLLKFQIDEIKSARLKSGEEEELNKQRDVLSNSEKIMNSLSSSYELLSTGGRSGSSGIDLLNEALSGLSGITRYDDKYEDLEKRLKDVTYVLDDIIEDIRKERDGMEFTPELLEQVEERIDLIYRLKRKYGGTISEILEYLRNAELELDQILKSEETALEYEKQLKKLDDELYKAANELNRERHAAAEILELKICRELEDLEMKRAQFKVNIEFEGSIDSGKERSYSSNGLDKVEFLISPNAGEPLKPLSKIASGGEMSRIMLAIKTILADCDDMPTLIFDEYDLSFPESILPSNSILTLNCALFIS
ncbi:MAG TPA: DNA repair protein RecN, partial [Clostridia bacterium]|nr:DNA repair protein RecN [Clostridia bacterium]